MQPLSSLPSSFGFEEVALKGHFPHLFNTEENIDYEGPLPDIKYYGVDDMKPKQAYEVKRCHANKLQENYLFNFK